MTSQAGRAGLGRDGRGGGGGGGGGASALVWGPLVITPKTVEMVAWSRDCRKTAHDQSLCQPGSLPNGSEVMVQSKRP